MNNSSTKFIKFFISQLQNKKFLGLFKVMAESETLVPDALAYYDKIRDKYSKLYKKVKEWKIHVSPFDLERNKISFIDSNGKEFLNSEYEVIGIFSNVYKLWVWAW